MYERAFNDDDDDDFVVVVVCGAINRRGVVWQRR
jgi:hypothetical protein